MSDTTEVLLRRLEAQAVRIDELEARPTLESEHIQLIDWALNRVARDQCLCARANNRWSSHSDGCIYRHAAEAVRGMAK